MKSRTIRYGMLASVLGAGIFSIQAYASERKAVFVFDPLIHENE
jgi:hypothetical protein